MRSDSKAVWFVLAFGATAALLSVLAGHPPERNIVAGIVGLVVGAGLVIALRWRP